jgi:hypothetical protein
MGTSCLGTFITFLRSCLNTLEIGLEMRIYMPFVHNLELISCENYQKLKEEDKH